MPFKPIQKLSVSHTLPTGKPFSVGVLAQQHIQKIIQVISNFTELTKDYGAQKSILKVMKKVLDRCRKDNKVLS